MATTRYPRLKLAISALSAVSVIAGAAYFRSAQDVSADAPAASSVADGTVITTAYQSGGASTTTAQSATGTNTSSAASRTANTAATARTSRGS